MFWERKLDNVRPIKDIKNLPSYSHSFFFKNMGPFKTSFVVLTLVTVISTTSRFFSVYLVSDLLSNVNNTSVDDLFYYYLPVFLGLILLAEFLDYFKRKYAEAFPETYVDHIKLRFYKTILGSKFEKILGFSKEKLNRIVGMYLEDIQKILNDWIWQTVTLATQLVIIIVILAVLNPLVLLVNMVLISAFLLIAFRISKDFSKYAKKETAAKIEADSTIDSFTLNLNAVKKNSLTGFFIDIYRSFVDKKWDALKDVRDFHSRRWLLQLILFNVIHVVTLFYSLYLVLNGTLELGFVVLIEWAYGQLWHIMVFVIEYRVILLQQKENSAVARKTFKEILKLSERNYVGKNWNHLQIKDASIQFRKGEDKYVQVNVPNFELTRGDKVGLLGQSGSGKSTILYMILQIVDFKGKYYIDRKELSKNNMLDISDVTLIDNDSPFFNVSLRENLLLGRDVQDKELYKVLEQLRVAEFENDIDKIFGESVASYSAGQMQRLRLARGILQGSDVYLLDEPFNGIDKNTKDKIINYLGEFLKDKTVVLISKKS